MKKERQIEIINLIINKLIQYDDIIGICDALLHIHHLSYINQSEYKFMLSFIHQNKPTKENEYKEFTDSLFWNVHLDSKTYQYWWETIGEKSDRIANQIRIDYLNKLINNII